MVERIVDALQLDRVDPFGLLLAVGILLLALLISLPVGWDREKATRALGLRTFPLVAIASAGFVVIGRDVLGPGSDAQSRILQGLMTGVGFLGGGAILKDGDRVRGTATAAAIWATAAIGAAVAHGRLEIALMLAAVSFVLLRFMRPVKKLVRSDDEDERTDGEQLDGSGDD